MGFGRRPAVHARGNFAPEPENGRLKRAPRRTATRTERNRAAASRIKTLAKKLESATDAESVKAAGSVLASAMDKAAKRGIVHPNKVARVKSKIAGKIKAAK